VALSLATVVASLPAAGFQADASLQALLVEYTMARSGPPGIAVALVTPRDVRFFSQGRADAKATAVGPDTGFEIGSVTKTMAAYLAVDAAARGQLQLDDALQRLLPPNTPRLAYQDREVRLIDLLTHTSGLPRLPPNLRFWTLLSPDPYAEYDEKRLLESLARPTLQRPANGAASYSNYGFGLAGYAITREEGGYAAALKRRIAIPLGMFDTYVAEPGATSQRMATGYGGLMRRATGYWHFTALAGAGGVRSTPRDMARYVQALLGSKGPLADALAKMREPRAPAGIPDTQVGLAWLTTQIGTRSIVWHNGMTGGFASMVAIDPATSEGVVVLANAAISMDALGFQILGVDSAAAPR
jgi:CubicO group peptidase (beta-lactamase class C family)